MAFCDCMTFYNWTLCNWTLCGCADLCSVHSTNMLVFNFDNFRLLLSDRPEFIIQYFYVKLDGRSSITFLQSFF